MPAGELASGLFGGVFRIFGWFFIEFILEILIKGLGFIICRIFSKKVDPDGVLVAFVGLALWVLLSFVFFFIYDYFSVQLAIDQCLDAGGKFNYEIEACES